LSNFFKIKWTKQQNVSNSNLECISKKKKKKKKKKKIKKKIKKKKKKKIKKKKKKKSKEFWLFRIIKFIL